MVKAETVISNSDVPIAQLARHGLTAMRHYHANAHKGLGDSCSMDAFLTRAIRKGLAQQTGRLESGLTVLASVGSTAPFIGLFGTVWGIYHALVHIGVQGQVSMGTVSGPIGEALVATAAGLAAAIPAVLAYNALTRANRVIGQELGSLCARFTCAPPHHTGDESWGSVISTKRRQARWQKSTPRLSRCDVGSIGCIYGDGPLADEFGQN